MRKGGAIFLRMRESDTKFISSLLVGGSGLKGETQGNKSKWICDGDAFHMFDIDTLPVDVSWQYCRVS